MTRRAKARTWRAWAVVFQGRQDPAIFVGCTRQSVAAWAAAVAHINYVTRVTITESPRSPRRAGKRKGA